MLKITLSKIRSVLDDRAIRNLFILQVGVVLLAFCEMLSIGLLAPFFSLLINPDILEKNGYLADFYQYSKLSKDSFIVFVGLIVFFVFVVTNAFMALVNYLIIRFSLNQGYRLSVNLFRSYLERDYLFFVSRNTSELTRVIFQDVSRLIDNVMMPLLMLLARLFSVIAIVGLLVFVDYQVTMIAILMFGGFYCLVFLGVRDVLDKIGKKFIYYNNLRFKGVSEAFGGIKDCKIYGVEDHFIEHYSINSKHDAKAQTKRRILLVIPRYLVEGFAIGALIIFSLILYSKGDSGELISRLMIFAVAGYRLMPSIQQIYANLSLIKSNYGALDIVVDDLSEVVDIAKNDESVNQSTVQFEKQLSLRDIYFSYPESSDAALKGVSLDIRKNSTVGFVGKTGSGKSTLIDVLVGLLITDRGNMKLDDVVLDGLNISSWKRLVGYVPQNIYLVDATLAENVAFGIPREKIDDARVWSALNKAQLGEFVSSDLDDGIETEVGENGVRLSGGQKQRIGIARALYREPEVLVFDEATSALDNQTERMIVETINALSGEMTILMIAHRTTTLASCDEIFVLDAGEVVDSGSYSKLMKTNEFFQSSAESTKAGG